jgi:hypothetical protein
MDTVEKYRGIIRRVLMDYVNLPVNQGDLRYLPVFDREHDRYLVIVTGWNGPRRLHNIVIQLDIIAGKIWLQCDNTDAVVAHDLERAGVPKKDIVLGFQPPEVRPLTEYAVA